METNERFWQGTLRGPLGPLGKYGGGFRFESGPQFLSVLFFDEFEKERLEGVARWEKEHGPSR
jgi:hypothetical protein